MRSCIFSSSISPNPLTQPRPGESHTWRLSRRRRPIKPFALASLLLLTGLLCAQQETLTATSTLVLVPATVRTPTGELLPGLTAADFRLTDNGVPQSLTLEANTERQPLAIVVLLQTGGAAPREFPYFRSLPILLESIAGTSHAHFAVLTFDSAPEDLWTFTNRAASLDEPFTHPTPGDDGAALLDAVNAGIDLLADRPAATRRILLLLSQAQDDGSKTPAQQIVRRLGENNITLFSLTFSPQKTWLKDQFTGSRHGNAPYQMSQDHAPVLGTFDLGTPLVMALQAMRKDAAAEVAAISGGEHVRFVDKHSLEQQMSLLANHIPNRYLLSFRPTSKAPGFHILHLELPNRSDRYDISARTSYWSTPADPAH